VEAPIHLAAIKKVSEKKLFSCCRRCCRSSDTPPNRSGLDFVEGADVACELIARSWFAVGDVIVSPVHLPIWYDEVVSAIRTWTKTCYRWVCRVSPLLSITSSVFVGLQLYEPLPEMDVYIARLKLERAEEKPLQRHQAGNTRIYSRLPRPSYSLFGFRLSS
jgi:hypothetical protein